MLLSNSDHLSYCCDFEWHLLLSGQCQVNKRKINMLNGQVDFGSTWFPLKTKPLVALQGLINPGCPVCILIWWSAPKCSCLIAICVVIAITFNRQSFATEGWSCVWHIFMWCLVGVLHLKWYWGLFGSKAFESAPSAQGNKTNGPNSNKLLQRQWASSQWFLYKLGHNAAVSQSIPHFLWDKLDDVCAECRLGDTQTQVHSDSRRHIQTLHLQNCRPGRGYKWPIVEPFPADR